jgi:hypothetical protein
MPQIMQRVNTRFILLAKVMFAFNKLSKYTCDQAFFFLWARVWLDCIVQGEYYGRPI